MKYYYFPGCSAKGVAKELDASFRHVAKELDIELYESPAWSCCGAGAIEDQDMITSHGINARNLSLAEEQGLDVATICSTCQVVLKRASLELRNRDTAAEVMDLLPKDVKFENKALVKHFIEILHLDYGLGRLRKKAKKPLGINVAPFYGCHILRPRYVLEFDDPENPSSMEKIIRSLGGEAVDYEGRLGCCGFHILMSNEKAALRMMGAYIGNALKASADCMVTPCPLCHMALDIYQRRALREALPVLHLPQLIGLALGMEPRKLGLLNHVTSTKTLLTKLDIRW